MHFYSQEEIEWLKANAPGNAWKKVTEMFNEYFNVHVTKKQLCAAAKRYDIRNGINAQFSKGNVPFNKGMKGINFGGENGKKTQFKKGSKPSNYRPVGSERISVDGYVEIKVADPNKWQLKHRVVWEREYGSVPKGYVVLFGDGNRCNFDSNNLILVSRKQLAILNKHSLIKDNADLTRLGIQVADLHLKINERKKG